MNSQYVSVLAHFRFIFFLPFCFLPHKLHKCVLKGVCEMLCRSARILNANRGRVRGMRGVAK